MDEAVAEEDRTLAACISAGTKYGSREMLATINEEERVLEGHNESEPKDKVDAWLDGAQEPAVFPEDAGEADASSGRPVQKQHSGEPTQDKISMYKHILPEDYKPLPSALQYEAKLQSMTEMDEAPPGLSFISNFITEEQEQLLIRLSRDFRWEQDVSTRRTAQFGFKYDYRTKSILPGTPWIKELDWLRDKLVEEGIFEGKAQQLIVNEITPPNGFGAHKDNEAFARTIAILGTQSAVRLIFWDEEQKRFYVVYSERRSLVVMEDDARYQYYHSIPEGIDDTWDNHTSARGVRISYTLRMMTPQYAVHVKK